MRFVDWLAWATLLVAVAGYVVGLRRSRSNDEAEKGLVTWMVLSWAAVAWLVASEVA